MKLDPTLKSDQFVQDLLQLSFEYLGGWRFCSLFGQSVCIAVVIEQVDQEREALSSVPCCLISYGNTLNAIILFMGKKFKQIPTKTC